MLLQSTPPSKPCQDLTRLHGLTMLVLDHNFLRHVPAGERREVAEQACALKTWSNTFGCERR